MLPIFVLHDVNDAFCSQVIKDRLAAWTSTLNSEEWEAERHHHGQVARLVTMEEQQKFLEVSISPCFTSVLTNLI